MTAALLLAALVCGQDVGSSAPDIANAVWINVKKAPKLRGKVGVVVFWSSDNPQSRMSLTGLQRLHEAFGNKVIVVAIARDDEAAVRKYLDRNDCTMATGADTGASTFWNVRGWPQAYLVDKRGKIAWKGDPFRVVREAWKLLKVETAAGKLLTALVKAGKNKRKAYALCDLLVATAPRKFDLGAWAKKQPRPDTDFKVSAPTQEGTLTSYVDGQKEAVFTLTAKEFDLAAWARAFRDGRFPLDAGELRALLKSRRYQTALDALVDRNPTPGVVAVAGRDKAFASYCKARAEGRRTFARKAAMAYHWPIAGNESSDNDAFWRELSVQSMMVDDKNKMTGLTIGNQDVMGPDMPAFAMRCLAQHVLMEAVGAKKPVPRDFAKQADDAYEKLVAELKAKYG